MDIYIGLSIAFFIIAFFYSMAGFGGGSSYLAILFLSGVNYLHIPKIALVCNLFVAGIALSNYTKANHFSIRKITPFIVASIPASFIGGSVILSKETFSILLGLSLFIASFQLFINRSTNTSKESTFLNNPWKLGIPIGTLLGFLAGALGIGGGIFLSPILIFTRWASVKEASALASFFILANSLSGLLSQTLKTGSFTFSDSFLILVVCVGGYLGSKLGSIRIPRLALQRVLSVLIMVVSIRLLSGVL